MKCKALIAGTLALLAALEPASAGASSPTQSGPVTLSPSVAVKRNLAGGESHPYQLSINVGEYMHAVVEQLGIDVVVTVIGPDGKQLAEVDRNEEGPETVLLIAESAGFYRLVVSAPNKNVEPGSYKITVEELRQATPQDTTRVAAERTVVEGERLQAQGTRESLTAAIDKLQEALPMFRASADQGGEALAQDDIGRAYYDLGEPGKALEYFNRALTLFKAAGDRQGEASTLNNVGSVYDDLGEKHKALEYYVNVLPIFRTLGQRSAEAIMLNNIAFVYQSLGETDIALDYYSRALPLRRALGDRQGEAGTLDNIGRIYSDLGETGKALDSFNRSLQISQSLGDKRGEANTLSNIGVVYRRTGDPRKALDYYNRSLPLLRTAGDRRGEAKTLAGIGTVYAIMGDRQKALDLYGQALPISRQAQDRAAEANTLAAIARVQGDNGHLAEAKSGIEQALAIVESLRGKVLGEELRASYLASEQNLYELYIDVLMRLHRQEPATGYNAMALEASERARARALLDTLAEADADIREGVDPALLERERALQHQLNSKERARLQLLDAKADESQIAAAQKELNLLLADYYEAQAKLRAASPRYAALTEPRPASFQEIQESLDPDTLLLEYGLGEETSYLWAVTRSSISSYELPKRSDIESAARRLYELVSSSQKRELWSQTRLALSGFSRIALDPVAGELSRKKLIVVADGALHYVPFAALPVPRIKSAGSPANTSETEGPLLSEHEVVSLPSISAVRILRQEVTGRPVASRTVAVLADPVLNSADPRVKPGTAAQARTPASSAKTSSAPPANSDLARSAGEAGAGGLERLRFTRQEADAIISLAESGLEAVDFEASRATATSAALAQYRIVHFATHGLVNSRHPELSGIVLSLVDEDGKPQDGFLRLHDIYNLRLGADLVVLSACQTALGKEVKGEGLMGLTRGFMYAGAPRVVASLWNVKDEATSELMKQFYKGMLKDGMRPAAALQQAQLSIMKQKKWEAPYYWAPFVLQGEWR
jgi:CHAT domain-containing protein/tetratricopeptide (TPR) repeat protein